MSLLPMNEITSLNQLDLQKVTVTLIICYGNLKSGLRLSKGKLWRCLRLLLVFISEFL